MAPALSANILLALAAAASWGGGDFSGGMGVKSAGGTHRGRAARCADRACVQPRRAAGDSCSGHAPLPHGAPLAWGLVAGVTAGISLTAFYIALARGAMGGSAALSGLLAAAIPAAVSSFLEGAPGAAADLRLRARVRCDLADRRWAVAGEHARGRWIGADESSRATLALALIGGIGFGIYFVALRLANPLGVVEPMAMARSGSLVTCALLLVLVSARSKRAGDAAQSAPKLTRMAVVWALGVAVLDTGGNLLFIAATRTGRLDIASVLASLYPAGTILLAAWHLHERPTRRQLTGMAIAAAAVAMITI